MPGSSPLGFLARGESVVALLVDEFLMSIADDVYLPLPAAVVRADLLTAFQSVIAALGGGWDGDLAPPAPPRRP